LFIKNTRKQLQRPDTIEVQWRTIKDENKKNYPWSHDIPAPQGLHLDIDYNFAAQHTEPGAKLWKKSSKRQVHGLQELWMIPCLGSSRALSLSDSQKQYCVMMAAKQQYLTNQHTTIRFKNSHILHLDVKINKMTLISDESCPST
jgi:hypothetical protein